MKNLTKSLILILIGILLAICSMAQVGISTDGSLPDSSAMLDVKSDSRGLLVPRMTSVQRTAIIHPAEGLLIYDLTSHSFWYFKNTAWSDLGSGSGWSLTGNAGINPAINFIGTTDNASLEFRTNNLRSGLIDLARDNTSLGAQTLLMINSGQQNTAIGTYALHVNDGWTNTAVGYASSFNQTDGTMNTALGGLSLLNNIHGSNNTALGQGSLSSNTIGNGNVALGYNAGYYEEGNDRLYIDNRLRSDLPQSRKRALIYGVFDDDPVNQSLTFNARVGIGTIDPDPSAALEISSGTRGFLPPRMNTAQRTGIINPAEGLMVYDTDFGALFYYHAGNWMQSNSGSNGWQLTGNSLTDPLTDFLGTTDDKPLFFRVNNVLSGILESDLTGNTSFGYNSLAGNSTGQENTALGKYSLVNNSTGNSNIAIGSEALYSNETGDGNTAIGSGALSSNISGISNVAIGRHALAYCENKSNLVAIGDSALYNNGIETTDQEEAIMNTAVGTKALLSNTIGSYNTAVGMSGLQNNLEGSYNTTIGDRALYFNDVGSENTAIGHATLYYNRGGSHNIANGSGALLHNEWGSSNIACGEVALYSNVTGHSNIAIGPYALLNNFEKSNLVAIGDSALYHNGIWAVNSWEASGNTATGSKTLFANTTGYDNTANGYNALYSNTTGNSNTANGTNSLYSNTIGYGNTACGGSALFSNMTGNDNTAVGVRANYSNISSGNTCVGVSAGDYCTFTNSTFLGYYAYPSSSDYTNCMSLGYDSHVDASNKVLVGNTSVTSIGGYAGWTNFSDGRFKKNVQENIPGLDFIRQLRPVSYSLDITSINADIDQKRSAEANGEIKMPERSASDLESIKAKEKIVYTGFIAQDVEATAKSIGYDFSGVDAPQSPDGHYGLRYAEFVVPLVKAVQEQQAMIEELKIQNEELKIQNEEIIKRIEALEEHE